MKFLIKDFLSKCDHFFKFIPWKTEQPLRGTQLQEEEEEEKSERDIEKLIRKNQMKKDVY